MRVKVRKSPLPQWSCGKRTKKIAEPVYVNYLQDEETQLEDMREMAKISRELSAMRRKAYRDYPLPLYAKREGKSRKELIK